MTATAYRSETVGTERDGFAQLLGPEWTKFRTVRGWVIGLVLAAVLTVAARVHRAGRADAVRRRDRLHVAVGPNGEAVVDHFFFVAAGADRRRQHHRPGEFADRPDS